MKDKRSHRLTLVPDLLSLSSYPISPYRSSQSERNLRVAGSDELNTGEIDALFREAGKAAPQQPGNPSATASGETAMSPEQVLDQAEADLAAAVAPDLQEGVPPELGDVTPFEMESFDAIEPEDVESSPLQSLRDVELDVRIELGRAELLIEEVLKLKQGSVVPLDKLAGDPVDILVNGRLIARGEVLVLNDNFCVRVAEILPPDF
jgi:flagellar motor switch protein FliN